MNSISIFAIFLPVFLLIAAIGFILPNYFRKDLLFGIKINEETIDQLAIKNNFKYSHIFITIIFLTLVTLLLYQFPTEKVGTYLIFIQIILLYILLVAYNRKVLTLKLKARLTKEHSQDNVLEVDIEKRAIMSRSILLSVIPSMILVVVHFIIFKICFDKIPEKIPSSFDLSGNIINYTTKNWNTVMWFPFISLFVLIVFIILFVIIKISKQELISQDAKTSRIQQKEFRKRWNGFFMILLPLLIIHNILISLRYMLLIELDKIAFIVITLIFPLLIVVAALVLALKTGQTGHKIAIQRTGRRKHLYYNDDKYWKLGLIYYNPNDPTIFVEKRMGIGWTINMANPIAVSGFILFIVLTFILIRYFR